MKHKIFYLLAFLVMAVSSCSKDDAIDADAPTVKFPLAQLNVDLNTVDNLPIIAIIQSKAGLAQVNVDINTEEEGVIHYKTITEFYNAHNYSLAESPEYKTGYTSVVVEAIDRQGQKVSAEMPITVKGVISRPVITFSPEQIVYDEMDENAEIPRTTFTVESEAGLTSVEAFLVSKGGQVSLGKATLSGDASYHFDEYIEYKEGDRGVKVVAEDTYGNASISTLPVTYKTVPVPVITIGTKAVFASSDADASVPVNITSTRGLKYVDIYRIEEGQATLAKHTELNGETAFSKSIAVALTQSTSQIKVIASDGRPGKEVEATAKAYVDMKVATLNVGSQPLANTGHKDYADSYGMVSLKDMKSYTVDYAIEGNNASNIDFKFYCFGGSAVPRLYSMDNTEKDAEFKGTSGSLKAITVKNATRFAVQSGFDFDNATVTSIKKILSSSITVSKLTPFSVGDVIAFRTGKTSAAGASKIGVMKVVNIVSAKTLGLSNATANVLVVEIKMPTK